MKIRRSRIIITAIAILAVALVTVGGKKRSHDRLSRKSISENLTFPKTFLWGTATAAEQLEATEHSDWAEFIRKNYAGEGKPVAGAGIKDLHLWRENIVREKTQHLKRFKEDFQLMKDLGANAYRFSIAWDRLFPRENATEADKTAVAFYDDLFAELAKQGLEPSVTLFHFSSPAWFFGEKDGKRGWERADAVAHFSRFVEFVVNRWGKNVNVWCTLNEPMVYIYSGYMQGIFPPLEKRPDEKSVAPVMEALLKAHAAAYAIIKKNNPKALVGVTQHTREFAPYRNYAVLDRIIAGKVEQAFIWDFTDAIRSGVLKVTNTDIEKPIPGLGGTQDFIGINYYGRFYIKSNIFAPTKFEIKNHDEKNPNEIKNELGWADFPLGMKNILLTAKSRYNLPLYILESGTAEKAEDDKLRQQLLITHLAETAAAMKDGADVRGYFHWSLIDNFEWAEGFDARFGLVAIDYQNNFARKKRKSFETLRKIITQGISPADYTAAAAAY
ncbi:MAG: glycoside hydrolase family 1 protein [Spirochaetes bacterium]|nr:glycoside hydrolase family 1 protein [Spirochaetota bacterium]